jgi:eukaryotic-like serine/threonine-protein kinase
MEYKDEEPGEIEVLAGRYQLQKIIGSGGMATIYRARDLQMDRAVAVKVLQEDYNTNPKFVRRFQIEAKAASALRHPNIVQVNDYGYANGNYYIVMELIEGINLHRYLVSRGVLYVDRAIIIAHDVALGLGAAHRRGIVHRDVKPQNVLIGKDGSIKLTDFGIVSMYQDLKADRITTTGMTLGTVQYFAPEQAQGEIVSPAADVYALGIVMYEMLTGRTPFDGNSPVAIAMQHIKDQPDPPGQYNPNIPAALEEIILRCLEKVPEKRFPDGSQLARSLEMLGNAEMGGSVSITPEHMPIPTSSIQIPSHPGERRQGGAIQTDHTHPPVSPYTNRMDPAVSSNQNRAGHVQGILAHQSLPGRRDWIFASSITTIILLATLLLLGFSVYLAVQLKFIPVPIFPGGWTPAPHADGFIEVPDLHTMSWSNAVATSEKEGFRLVLVNGQTKGVVVDQNPKAHDKAANGSTIDVKMEIMALCPPLRWGLLFTYNNIYNEVMFSYCHHEKLLFRHKTSKELFEHGTARSGNC